MSETQESRFLEAVLAGNARPDDIHEFIDRWHESSENRALPDYLGLTKQEYAAWVENPQELDSIIQTRRSEAFPPVIAFLQARERLLAERRVLKKRLAEISHALSTKAAPGTRKPAPAPGTARRGRKPAEICA